jgi:predicted O-linked N-acetylglucosamine transferase (SPINDLY family)
MVFFMNWNPHAYRELLAGNYDQVVQIYEQLSESEPEIIDHYWYLGLAYLLLGEEEAAQTTWLLILSQEGQDTLLEEILETEAKRQKYIKDEQLSWLIRRYLREINPSLINNILELVILEINLEIFQPLHLESVNEILEQAPTATVSRELLLKVLDKVLQFPAPLVVSFAKISSIHLENIEEFIGIVKAVIITMIHHGEFFYAVDLGHLCLSLQPQNLVLLDLVISLNLYAGKYKEALAFAYQLYSKSQSTDLKLFANYQILYSMMLGGAWLEPELYSIAERHKMLLNDLLLSSPSHLNPLARVTLPMLTLPLLYLEDNPRLNRPLQNQISALFHQHLLTWLAPLEQKSIARVKRPLNIAYIAHTLRNHSVGYLSRWLLYYHNREDFKIFLYRFGQKGDAITEKWFQNPLDKSYDFAESPRVIAEQIQNDQIDILVDLDSLTSDITYQVMGLKPAPLQVTWLGLDASGLPTIDYFIADSYVLPDDAQDYYQEKIWRLPDTYIAVDGFEVGVSTLRREDLNIGDDALIYSTVQNGTKRHPQIIRLQMEILKNVPHSYLLIKGMANESKIQALFLKIAQEVGINPERLRFLNRDATSEIHRANLTLADVVLDTYPYNGATTTLEVLWMGIPLVTRVGEQFAARNSYAFMNNLGITEGIARTDAEYINWGIRLGTDENLRASITNRLIKSRQTSPLWQGERFAREMEKAYQQMWEMFTLK